MTGYPLDEDLVARVEGGEAWALRVWEPPSLAVVLGRASRPGRELHAAHCAADAVPILRRLGGGGAVLLGPGCLVVSLARVVADRLAVATHLAECAGWIADGLRDAADVAVEPRGTGDLCLGDRKVLGSSVFCRRHTFFYQASLLVAMDRAPIERYLAHPSREPAYRRGRPHREFLVTLWEAGHRMPTAALAVALEDALSRRLSGAASGGGSPGSGRMPAGPGRLVTRDGVGV